LDSIFCKHTIQKILKNQWGFELNEYAEVLCSKPAAHVSDESLFVIIKRGNKIIEQSNSIPRITSTLATLQ